MKMMYRRVVVIGSVGFDHVMELPGRIGDFFMADKLDRLNVSFTVETLRREFGGTGGNCAYSLGLLGVPTTLVSAWGNDAEAYKTHIEAVGVGTKQMVFDPDVFSAWGHVMTDKTGNQLWMYYPGPLKQLRDIDLTQIVRKSDLVVLMPCEPKAFVTYVDTLIAKGVDYVFDPAFFIPNLTKAVLKRGLAYAKVVIGNDYEITLMERKVGAPMEIWLGGGKLVVKTVGEKGSYIYQDEMVYEIPAVKVKAVDPTGAGDTYRSGLVAGMMHGLPIEVSGRMGALAAAYCVEKPGAQAFGYTKQEFKERYRKEFGERLAF